MWCLTRKKGGKNYETENNNNRQSYFIGLIKLWITYNPNLVFFINSILLRVYYPDSPYLEEDTLNEDDGISI